MGNQMFQYAAGKALAIRYGVELKIDLSFLLQNTKQNGDFIARPYELSLFKHITDRTVDTEKQYLPKFLRTLRSILKLNQPPVYYEPSFQFNASLFEQKPPLLMDGYWQSEKYFIIQEQAIRNAFTFPSLEADDLNIAGLHEVKDNNSISVHVRRGDYLNKQVLAFHGICSRNYYEKAIDLMNKKHPGAIFFFFSDDPEWVKQELVQLTTNYRVIEGNSGRDSWKDMLLMSNCKHHIIANSSFSWWGAWLNNDLKKTVVAPRQWFSEFNQMNTTADLLPAGWVQL